MFNDLFKIFPKTGKSPWKGIKNDEYLLLLIADFHFNFIKRHYVNAGKSKLISEYAKEIKMAILQCSTEELMKVAKIICQDGKADPSEWRIRLSNFALTLFSEVKII